MCAITLTVLPSCKHELPTIDYCSDVAERLKSFESKRKLGVTCKPPKTCTNSLGWTIFKRIEAPVKCEGCKMWLWINGKKTYSDMVTEETDATTGGSNKKVKFEKDDEDGKEPAKKEDSTEMEKLRSSLSRTFGTTGQRRRRYY